MGNPVTHFEIAGADPQMLQAFYRDAFGWEVVPAGPTYAMVLPHAGDGINGGVGAAPEGGASRVTVYIEVDDLHAALDRIAGLGGSTITAPLNVPNGPSIALFSDPEGHVIGLTKAATIRGR